MSLACKTWRAEAHSQQLREFPRGLDWIYDGVLGWTKQFLPKKMFLLSRAKKILELSDDVEKMSNSELKKEANSLKEIFLLGRENYQIVNRGVAVIREVCYRQLKMRPYLVQVAGGLAIELGHIAEMATGEGKTLTATIPGVLAGWRGKGCHIMTSNSYLATRDAELMRPVYEFCEVSVSSISETMKPEERQEAYLADITYCTNNDVAADLLRDELALGPNATHSSELLKELSGLKGSSKKTVLRGLDCAIIDEADSVMIDDGVTPLLISGESGTSAHQSIYIKAKELADNFIENVHYKVEYRFREIILLEAGIELLGQARKNLGGIWEGNVRSKELLNQALTVRHFFLKDKQYIIDDGKVVIVDEATGRLMPDRFWRAGIHQSVEAKEGVEINADKETYARISFQKFFNLYRKLSGMTGTAKESRLELWQYYHLQVIPIPRNKKCIRKQHRNQIFRTQEEKLQGVLQEVQELHETGRPILVGTGSIKDSQRLSEILTEHNLDHQVLNAIFHEQEASIIERAGEYGKITISTNMAGRGTDIKLTEKARKKGGLHVMAIERFESGRIDRQLYGRSARQGDAGSAIAMLSFEDSLIISQAGLIGTVIKFLLTPFSYNGRINLPGLRILFELCQWRAMRQGRRQRKSVMDADHHYSQSMGFAGKQH